MKLRTKIFLLTVGLITVLGLAVVTFVNTKLTNILLAEFKENGIFQTQQFANMVVPELLTENRLRLQMLMNDYRKEDRHVRYIFIQDAGRKLLAHTFTDGFPEALISFNNNNLSDGYSIEHFIAEDEYLIDIAMPILQSRAGFLHIGFTETPIHDKVYEVIALLLGIITTVLAAGGGVAMVFATIITKPVHKLAKAANMLGQGNLDCMVDVKSTDEIGQLGITFNKMVMELRSTTVSRDYLTQVINSMIDIVLIVSKDSMITMVNQSAEKILGYSIEFLIGKPYNLLCINKNGDCASIEILHDNSIVADFETFFRTKDGRDLAVILTVSPIRNDSADSESTVIVAKDNTEYRNTREELIGNQKLLASEHEKLNTLFGKVALAKKEWELTMDCVGDLIILTEEDGTIKRINKQVKEFTNRPYTEILGINWEELIQEQGLESHTFYAGGVEFFQKTTGKWYLLNSYPFNSEVLGYTGTVITLHETTELKHIAEQLEETSRTIEMDRAKLKNALEQISLLIQNVTYQKNYDVTFTNPHLEKCYEVKKCGKEDCPCYGHEAVRCWQVAGTFCGGKIQGAFAQKYQNCAECNVFKDATTDPIYQIGEQFNNMMHVLEIKNRQLEDAYSELKATQAQILQREKMASIGQLAAGVAHEINNPMGFISSNLGTLGKYLTKLTEFITAQGTVTDSLEAAEASGQIKDLRKKLKIDYILEDIQQLINESLDGADRVKKIVQNLKSFSRVDEADYKYTDINECIESTLNIVWNELKYKATVTKEYGELPATKCYPQQLNQVFMNILVNAAHAIEKQGEIQIKTWNGDGFIKISISDSGSGIPEDKINKIFEPFFTTKPVGQGTGLGLSITYDIVKKHNGEITVDSEVGKGTTFTVKLPVVIEEKKA